MPKSKKKPSKNKEKASKSEIVDVNDINYLTVEPHLLIPDNINLWVVSKVKERDIVAAPTPDYVQVKFERESIEPLPANLSNLDMLKVPYIREMGIQSCIELLGRFFNCNSYETNHLHFWFLDVITDCLWRLQDDFQLPTDDQKKVLEYFLYFFKMIMDTRLNYSRKVFLRTFKETIYLIGDLIEEGCTFIPSPNELFTFADYFVNDSDDSIVTSTSSIANSTDDEMEAHIGVKLENVVHLFKLHNHILADNQIDDVDTSKASSYDPMRLPSDEDTITSSAIIHGENRIERGSVRNIDLNVIVKPATSITYDTLNTQIADPNMNQQHVEGEEAFNLSDFYQPDMRTPPRFLSSELAFARYTAKEMEYLANDVGAEENCGYDSIDGESSSPSSPSPGLVMGPPPDSENNAQDRIGKNSQLSNDISQFLLQIDPPCALFTAPTQHRKGSQNREWRLSTGPTRHSGKVQSVHEIVKPSSSPVSLNNPSDTSSSHTINRMIRATRELIRTKQLQPWQEYNVMRLRIANMADPGVGWQPAAAAPDLDDGSGVDTQQLHQSSSESIDMSAPLWREIILAADTDGGAAVFSRNADERKRINVVVTSAIIDCVFEYLYDHFHFTLIKLAFQSTPYVINQNVNVNCWKLPKVRKAEFLRPARPKVKSPKGKISKSKSTRSKSKSSKKSAKSKKSKKSSSKSKKLSKRSKGSKGPKMSKAERDRLKKEKVLLEEEQRKVEENKKYMFPLTDAATDNLFQNMYENWVKPKGAGKKHMKENGGGKTTKGKKKKKK